MNGGTVCLPSLSEKLPGHVKNMMLLWTLLGLPHPKPAIVKLKETPRVSQF